MEHDPQTPEQNPPATRVRRREAILAAGSLGLGSLFGAHRLGAFGGTDDAQAASCVLTPEVTEGPYWIDTNLTRRDIREGRTGLRLDLVLTVENARTCAPIEGADVEIWHCDADGVYSGVQGNSGNFLRGGQRAGSKGHVRFETIVPGWYTGRTPHIHMKVFVSGNEIHTGQVFFRPRTLREVYAQGVYAGRGQADRSNSADSIYREAGARAVVPLERKGSTVARGFNGALTIGVSPSQG
jgi:hypothetical protein